MSTRWGKAGVRLTSDEIESRNRAARSRRNQDLAERRRNLEVAYRLWRHGEMQPCRITFALDCRGLHGPEVDEACGAAEPDVDLWEAGKLYPTWEQVLLLAELTRQPVRFFTAPDLPVPFEETTMRFHMPPGEHTEPVVSFDPVAVAKTVADCPERLPDGVA